MYRKLSLGVALLLLTSMSWAAGLDDTQITTIRSVGSAVISPDGSQIAYTLSIPRTLGDDKNGPAWSELRMRDVNGDRDRRFLAGDVGFGSVRFSPDGSMLTYLAKRGDDEHRSLWALPVDGGESRKLLEFETGISSYRLSPDGTQIAFIARAPEDEDREKAKKKGYTQEVFEEDWRHTHLYLAVVPKADCIDEPEEPKSLELPGSAFQVEWAPNGERLAVTLAPRPLIDERYMMQRIHVIDAESGEIVTQFDNRGKLGTIHWSPNSRNLAIISAADANDPSAGRLMVGAVSKGKFQELMPGIEEHINSVTWKDDKTLLFLSDVGCETRLAEIDLDGKNPKTHFTSGGSAGLPLPRSLSASSNGSAVALVAERPTHPRELFISIDGGEPKRLTDQNPWLADVDLAKQEVVRITARDGLEFEGMLIHPLNGAKPAPLILMVHGGPESHDRNGWLTNYSRPGQLAAAQGYAVFYPNYRGSTGRGVAFSKTSQGDAAGAEFDDLADAVDQLVKSGVADRERVGITGGSYGGYATAWGSTRYTDVFRAGVMFVGISNKISKGLTTEIPVEDVMVHTRFDPWKKWDFSLERSPIFHAEKSRTALLIAHGQEDTRVHPAQSLQLFRALKLIGKTPVRYIRYPGEGHGNRRAASRDDYTRRMMRWFDHFLLTDSRELPPWDLAPPFMQDDEETGEESDD